jgi:hypothetical protein
MSTPFPPNSKLKGLSAYAPPHVRDRALSVVPAETADTPAQTETSRSVTEPQTEGAHTPAVKEASPANNTGNAEDPLDWIEDAIREVVSLKHASDAHGESDPAVSDASSPSITPLHDQNDDWPPSGARRRSPPRLETRIVPPPPPPERQTSRLGLILKTSLAIVFAAMVAYGVTLFYSSWPSEQRAKGPDHRVAETTPRPTESQPAPQTRSHVSVEDEQAFANEPVSLAVNVEPATDNELLLLNGLAQGTTLSAGTSISPSSWQVPPDKLSGLYLYAPKDFVGVMNTTVNLLGPDKTLLDSRDMRLKWISRPPQQASQPTVASVGNVASARNEVPTGVHGSAAPPDAPAVKSIDPGEAALLMQRGHDSLSTGDISAARVAFRRLADAGVPDAALALANTYDPAYLAAHNVVGVVGDRALARTLYQRAKTLGSTEASRILADMMTQ